jgi:hypothetical protein
VIILSLAVDFPAHRQGLIGYSNELQFALPARGTDDATGRQATIKGENINAISER